MTLHTVDFVVGGMHSVLMVSPPQIAVVMAVMVGRFVACGLFIMFSR